MTFNTVSFISLLMLALGIVGYYKNFVVSRQDFRKRQNWVISKRKEGIAASLYELLETEIRNSPMDINSLGDGLYTASEYCKTVTNETRGTGFGTSDKHSEVARAISKFFDSDFKFRFLKCALERCYNVLAFGIALLIITFILSILVPIYQKVSNLLLIFAILLSLVQLVTNLWLFFITKKSEKEEEYVIND